MDSDRQRDLYTVILGCYILMIIILAVLPQPARIGIISDNDKVIHALEFFVFSLLLTKTLSYYVTSSLKLYAVAVIIVGIVAFVSELVQLFTGDRSFSKRDMLADFIGAAFALLVFWAYHKYIRKDY